jgi:hypothetical protein
MKWFRQLFCSHTYEKINQSKYDVINRWNGVKSGEVTLTLITCSRCGKDKLIPSNNSLIS